MFATIHKIYRFFRNATIELFGNPLVVNACVFLDDMGEVTHDNWGDDINYFFVKEIAKQRWLSFREAPIARFCHRPNYVIIGSVIDMLLTPDSIVWGSGLITGNPKRIVRPKKICAVRGPKTREVLLGRGIDCPEVYGDPALLVSCYYQPKVEKKYKMGIIPHYADIDKVAAHFASYESVKVIRIQGYKDWTEFVDEVNQCECIASSSLHGLILSEAYSIPNVWIQNAEGEITDTFKYEDFFASIGKDARVIEPIVLKDSTTAEELIEASKDWRKGHIDLQPLIDVCPFEIIL